MKGLDEKKFEVEFACAPGGPLIGEISKEGIKFQPINHFVQEINIFKDFRALLELIHLLKRGKYDIVHTHNSKAGFLGRLSAKIAKVPIIVHTIHGFAFHEYERPPRRLLFILLEKFAAKFAGRLITVSQPLTKWGLEIGVGSPEKYVTIYDGIEIDKFQVKIDIHKKRQEFGIKPGDKVVGAVAKLWEGKGHKTILEAAKTVVKKSPQVRFIFVGEGYLRKELESYARDLGVSDYVIFAGFREDIPEVTAIFDIAVLVSLFEGLGRVLLEAMVLGKPVVATRVGGIVDVVKDGETGILVSPEDPEGLARAITTLLEDENSARRMGEAGKRRIDSKFTARTMVERIEQVYEKLLEEKGTRK
jgi:glycosyltransferase involved in cell wall biosynthesis